MAQPMDPQQLQSLRELIHIDFDAVTLYDSVLKLKTLNAPIVEQALMEFRSDHLRHIRELNDRLEALGEKREHLETRVEQCKRHGFTPVKQGMSTEDLISATVDGEEITNQTYERLLKGNWDPQTRALIDRNFADEQRHLLWVLRAARTRLWQQEAPVQPGA